MSIISGILFPPKHVNLSRLQNNVGGKTIVITGATYGIGEELTRFLADYDCQLILVARTTEKLETLKTELSAKKANIYVYPCDLRDEKNVGLLIEKLNANESIDVFINNAGKSIRRGVWESLDRFHDFQRTNSTNYLGPVQLILGVLPSLMRNKGQIINISAINVLLQPAPKWSAYQASKSAFDQWFRSVEAELRAKDVSTATVYLPLVRTRMMAPTKEYDNYPAMSVSHVVRIVCQRLYKKNRNFKPYWSFFGQLGSICFGRVYVFIQTKKLRNSKK